MVPQPRSRRLPRMNPRAARRCDGRPRPGNAAQWSAPGSSGRNRYARRAPRPARPTLPGSARGSALLSRPSPPGEVARTRFRRLHCGEQLLVAVGDPSPSPSAILSDDLPFPGARSRHELALAAVAGKATGRGAGLHLRTTPSPSVPCRPSDGRERREVMTRRMSRVGRRSVLRQDGRAAPRGQRAVGLARNRDGRWCVVRPQSRREGRAWEQPLFRGWTH